MAVELLVSRFPVSGPGRVVSVGPGGPAIPVRTGAELGLGAAELNFEIRTKRSLLRVDAPESQVEVHMQRPRAFRE